MIYYKSFDPNLCGWGGFQYEIGKEFTVEDPENPKDAWMWAHFSPSMECCIHNSHNLAVGDGIPRVCEVTPIGRTHKFGEWIGSHSVNNGAFAPPARRICPTLTANLPHLVGVAPLCM